MSERTAMPRLRERLARQHPRVRALAVALLAADAALALLHIGALVFLDGPAPLRLDLDHSIAEWVQYAQYALVIALLSVFVWRRRAWALLVWPPLFAFFLADDALLVHERVGYLLRTRGVVGPVGPFDAQAVGELAAPLVGAGVMTAALAVSWRASAPPSRRVSRSLLVLVAALAFFGVVVDLLHSLVSSERLLDRAIGFGEDLGGMLVLSCIAVFAAALVADTSAPGAGRSARVLRAVGWRDEGLTRGSAAAARPRRYRSTHEARGGGAVDPAAGHAGEGADRAAQRPGA
ncbi:hypothetical protein [Microbacterium sediminis]|uniref:hypothetical protein n=1 Tax=Microbacterium sediminis TaxID=904291 RepID=UPI001F0B17DC|nr:hypothetical protein [Microbacterium sediminis]